MPGQDGRSGIQPGSTVPVFLILGLIACGLAAPALAADSPMDLSLRSEVQPLLRTYCVRCHGPELQTAGIDFSAFTDHQSVVRDRGVWLRALRVLKEQEMPPVDPQPTTAERSRLVEWIDEAVNRLDWSNFRHPGSVTIPRLNRTEYNNTIRDLTGLDLRPADAFPPDGQGESGFRNDRDGLFVAPLLVEKYLAAAHSVAEALVATTQVHDPLNARLEVEDFLRTETNQGLAPYGLDLRNYQQTVYRYVSFPRFGRYRFRVRAWGESAVEGLVPGLTLRVGGIIAGQEHVTASPQAPHVYEFSANIPAGSHRVSLHWFEAHTDETNDHNLELAAEARLEDEQARAAGKKPPARRAILSLDWIEIVGRPAPGQDGSLVWTDHPGPGLEEPQAARAILERFARRAYRRPVQRSEVNALMALYRRARRRGETFERAVGMGLRGALASPSFLFRAEKGGRAAGTYRLDDHELASRLSYFLWMSMPDEELSRVAETGRLGEPETLEAQARRMLADPRSRAFTSTFIGQWLGFAELGSTVRPDDVAFPEFTPALGEAMVSEAEMFFDRIVREDRSLLELLDADYTYLNEELARHYGLQGVTGRHARLVELEDRRRGGVLGMGAVLTATSLPTRTSPVVRGKWVLETMLGRELPPPPPDAGELSEPGESSAGMTLRQMFEMHRDHARCATCHDRIDPIGFGLENFDAIGRWRDLDNDHPVDAKGVLPDGTTFDGPGELRRILLAREEQFARTVSAQMLKFSLGRDLAYYDEPTVAALSDRLLKNGFRAIELVAGIVTSYPFRFSRAADEVAEGTE